MTVSLLRPVIIGVVLLAITLAGAVLPPPPLAAPGVRPTGSGLLLSADPTSGPAPLFVAFAVSPPNGTTPAWSWSFGDGSYWNGTGPNYTSVVHVYQRPGTFTAIVTASWSSGQLRANATIQVAPANLFVAINATPETGTVPFTVDFEARPSGGSGTYVSFLWNFGDGSAGSGASVRYTYLRAGTFQVHLGLTDSGHRTAAASAVVVATTPGGGGRLPSSGSGGGPTLLGLPLASVLAAGAAGAGLAILAVALVWVWQSRRRETGSSDLPVDKRDRAEVGEAVAPVAVASSAGIKVLELAANLGSPIPAVGLPAGEGPSGPRGPAAGWGRPEPAGRSPAPTPSSYAAPAANRSLAAELLRHLESLPRPSPGELPSREWTQAGLAESLGVGQSAVSKVLRRLALGGVVVAETGHVRGSARRVRVYRLTPRGEQLARALRPPPGPRP